MYSEELAEQGLTPHSPARVKQQRRHTPLPSRHSSHDLICSHGNACTRRSVLHEIAMSKTMC